MLRKILEQLIVLLLQSCREQKPLQKEKITFIKDVPHRGKVKEIHRMLSDIGLILNMDPG